MPLDRVLNPLGKMRRSARAMDPDVARLAARPGEVIAPSAARGLHTAGLRSERDAWVYVPKNYAPRRAAPFILMLHGAGVEGSDVLPMLDEQAEEYGLIIAAPASVGPTWDFLTDGFGDDVEHIDRVLSHVFTHFEIDPRRVAIAGFSDGASYALSLGMNNGDLFTHMIAFSPGFIAPPGRHGEPHVFVSHGVTDSVLPIESCSRRIVPALSRVGYDVKYEEFRDGHKVPSAIASSAVRWFLGR